MDCDVMLVNPRFPARFSGAPMNLLALATYSDRSGLRVRLVDLCTSALLEETIISEIERMNPLLVAIGSYSSSHLASLNVAREVKSRFPNVVVVKGGIHETFVPMVTLRNHPYVDYVVRGDGERPLLGLTEYLRGKRAIGSVQGISFRSKDGRIVQNPPESPMSGATLGTLPAPDRTFLEDRTYYDFPIFGGKRTAQVMTTRGCLFKCTFCPASKYPGWANGAFRWRTVQSVVEELEVVKGQGYEAVFFDDSVFSFNEQRVRLLCSTLSELGFEWGCQTRVDLVSPELLSTMRKAGCSYIFYGVETGDNHQLKVMCKQVIADQSWEAVQQTVEAGIRVGVSMMLGYPGETDAQVLAALRKIAAFDEKLVRVSLSMFALYPGTEDWLSALKSGLVKPDAYELALSTEEVWTNFDEGFGAIHLVTVERAEHLLELATRVLGPCLFKN